MPNYAKQPKNAQAMKVVLSWLRAVGVEASDGPRGSSGVIVECSNGQLMEVVITDSPDDERFAVSASELASPSPDVAMAEFHKITLAAGYGEPIPVDRGEPPKQRLYGDDMFLSVVRHREFRHAPDLPQVKVDQYKFIVERSCRSFYAKNRNLLESHGYDVDDLGTFAWVWTHIFVHKYEVMNETNKLGDDNARLLTKYLRQRFFELFKKLRSLGRSTFPEPDTAHVALLGRLFDAKTQPAAYNQADEEVEPTISYERRRAAAIRILSKLLDNLPHDERLASLERVIDSTDTDASTKKAAKRLLSQHRESCSTCTAA